MPPPKCGGRPIRNQTAESFGATFETNVLGVVRSMKHEVRTAGQGSGSYHPYLSNYGHRGDLASIYVGDHACRRSIHSLVEIELAK